MLFNTLLSGTKLVPSPAPGTASPLLGPALGTASPLLGPALGTAWPLLGPALGTASPLPPCCCAAPAGRDVLAGAVFSTAWPDERP